MNKKYILLLLIIGISALSVSCASEEQYSTASPEATVQANIPEAYLNLPDATAKPSRTVAVTNTEEPAPSNSQVDSAYNITNVTLTEANLYNLPLYRLEDSNYLITKPLDENSNTKKSISNCANLLNSLQAAHPDVKFYTYFINRATNCDWYSNTASIFAYDYSNYFTQALGSNTKITSSHFSIKDLQDYMDTGYKTDFHVNNKGSYRVYQDVYGMLGKDFSLSEQLTPVKELDFDGLKMIGDLFSTVTDKVSLSDDKMDDFKVYTYDIGSYKSYVNDVETTIGMEKEYASGEINRDPLFGHQFSYYGGQSGVVRFEFNQKDKPNLLILSDSQGRPSRKMLASHFNTTVYLDDVQWRSMDIGQVIDKYDIDAVVLMGQISMFEIYDK